MDESVLDDAAAAAAAELGPVIDRLGVYGLHLDQLLVPAVRAAAAVLVEHHDDECSHAAAGQLLDLSERVAVAVDQRDAALAELGVVRGQLEQCAGELLVAQAETTAAAARVGVLVQALTTIDQLPYDGPEPSWRRAAREALA
jgi:hypothetical protein